MSRFTFTIPLNREIGPYPVSVNAMYRRGSDGLPKLTPEAKRWRECVQSHAWGCWWMLGFAERETYLKAPRWRVTYAFTLPPTPPQRQFDRDNLLKLCNDALQRATGCNDRRYDSAATVDYTGAPLARLTVTVEPIEVAS
jgi:hypothetical protein